MANWVVVGSGALGTLWALGLQQAGASVTIYSRHVEDSDGITLTRTFDDHKYSADFPVITTSTNAPDNAIWLLMVKAWQLAPLLKELQLDVNTPLIVSHNGMGAADDILQTQTPGTVFDLVTTHGAWRQQRTHSYHAGLGQSWIGARHSVTENTTPDNANASNNIDAHSQPVDRIPTWFDELAAALPPLHWQPNITEKRWEKLAINCAINPLATLAEAANGVLRDESYAPNLRAICEEIANVNTALDADELLEQVREVIRNTAGNRCSMLQDVDAKRRTEIDYLNGFICREGERLLVATRENCRLWEAIQARERAYE
ncbi:2-dehydropantoate 2-reductase [Aliidiomarina halalkaliphila]|uniref:2-dehydropantoate 2-reductase n=1 Tax=Aliidiomarina halalkaliphila TaxID=2593535 RepID=A0A552X552_9GAMM|nr:2-dehydropantoate 2-reductase [Aliidiomarina halalkaliphila]TRW50135.1 2-dehydropantoate 2-reductase [Aliidiomarina halalkaliphila]